MRHVTPAARTASAHARARCKSRSTGFSQKIALPAFAARTMRSACVSVDDPIATARTPASSNTLTASVVCAPCCWASFEAAAASTSTTYLSRTPGWRAILPAWIAPMRPAPNNATSVIAFPPGSFQHPFVRGVVVKMPFARWPRHHVEVIRFVPVRHDDRMVAARNHDDVVILDGERLVERAIVGVDALERKALRRIQAMVVRFLERAFLWQVVGIVLMRRIARRMPARRAHFHDEQMARGFGLRQDVANEALVRASAAHRSFHLARLDDPR